MSWTSFRWKQIVIIIICTQKRISCTRIINIHGRVESIHNLVLIAGETWGDMEPLHELWFPEGVVATLALQRFKRLSPHVRFDEGTRVGKRRKNDTVAAFGDVWKMFFVGLCRCYTPGVDIAVEEQLVPVRGKLPLRMYLATSQPRIAPCCGGIMMLSLHNH